MSALESSESGVKPPFGPAQGNPHSKGHERRAVEKI
jgi:hypothetical protein